MPVYPGALRVHSRPAPFLAGPRLRNEGFWGRECTRPMAFSEHQLQGELQQPRIVVLIGDYSKLRRAQRLAGQIELNAIEQIVELRAELQVQALIECEACILEHGKVEVVDPGAADIRQSPRWIAERG